MDLRPYKISENQLVSDAIEMIQLNDSRCVMVVNPADKVVGIVSEGDILRSILKGGHVSARVKTIMNPSFKSLNEGDEEKIDEFFKRGLTMIPILKDNNVLKAIVTLKNFYQL